MLFFVALILISNSGPGLWVLSQALLLLYFKMDNGSNVCGIEFNFDNKEKKEGETKNRGGRSRGEGGGQGDGENKIGGGEGGEEAKDDSESLIGAVNNEIRRKLFLGFGVKSEAQIMRNLFLGIQVKSETGRSVLKCKVHFVGTVYTSFKRAPIALWGRCNGKLELGIFHF